MRDADDEGLDVSTSWCEVGCLNRDFRVAIRSVISAIMVRGREWSFETSYWSD